MVEGFKANFKNMYGGQDTDCDACKQDSDSQCHALVCKAYEDLREGMDIRASQFLKFSSSFFLEAIRLCVDLI